MTHTIEQWHADLPTMSLLELAQELLRYVSMQHVSEDAELASWTQTTFVDPLKAELARRDAETSALRDKVARLEDNWAAHQMECHALQADDGRPPLVDPDAPDGPARP